MKKTLTVNLGGTVFNIDDDAYRLLDNYLSNLKIHFRKEAGADEIVDDIERRIFRTLCREIVGRFTSNHDCRCGRGDCPHGKAGGHGDGRREQQCRCR